MDRDILYNYFDRINLNSGDLEVFYSFENVSGNVVYNDVYSISDHWGDGYLRKDRYPGLSVGYEESPTYTGSETGIGGFNKVDLVRIGHTVDFENWTAFLNYRALEPCALQSGKNVGQVLLTSMIGGVNTSGFTLGINESNRTFFECQQNDIPLIYTLNQELGQHSIVSLSKNGDDYSLGYHNYGLSENKYFEFSPTGITTNNEWFLGGFFSGVTNYSGLSGHYDDVLLFSKGLSNLEKEALIPAFFTTGITEATLSSGTEVKSPISSVLYNTGAIIGTGVTGYSYQTGILVGQLSGDPIHLVCPVEMTGNVIGKALEFVTGDPQLVSIEVNEPEEIHYDCSYLLKYNRPNFMYYDEIDGSDFFEVYGFDCPPLPSEINQRLQPNPILSTYDLPIDYTGQNVNIYLNGVLQQSGFDYTTVGTRLFFTTGFAVSDNILYDQITGQPAAQIVTGSPTGQWTLTDSLYENKDIFTNGIKLVSGLDYSGDGSNVWIIDSSYLPSGWLQFVPRHPNISEIQTGYQNPNISQYLDEQIYLNGQRLTRGYDYERVSTCSLRLENSVNSYTGIIYNNEETFFL